MIRIDALKEEISRTNLYGALLPGEPYLLVIPDVLRNHSLTKRATGAEVYALRSAILVGDVFPTLYGKLEVDFVRTNLAGARENADSAARRPALRLTYIPEGIQDARVTMRVDKTAKLPEGVRALMHGTTQRAELARALWEQQWPVRLIAEEFGCSNTLIRRDIGRPTLDHRLVARYAKKIPQAPMITTVSKQGVYARDRDTEFEFRKAIGAEQLCNLKARAERYAAMRLGRANHPHTQAFGAQLWRDVHRIVNETGVPVSRLAVELGYSVAGLRGAIASAAVLSEFNPSRQKEASGS
ncbi:hypothetical protein [Mycobacteroides abscessus]|uniref:hypothetical protein n=1 Tax=Mycobacteroides abscessus TaxID=36809 RepID=UPI000C25A880|nr:hypothetical protein [Mycobacteroides abscessus]